MRWTRRMSSISSDEPSATLFDSHARAVFEAHGLTKVYHMGEVEVHALRGVDLELVAGEFVVLLGPSGSGKSTLLNILGGLDVPSSGTVHYNGQQLTEFDDAALTRYRREELRLFLQFYLLVPCFSAQEYRVHRHGAGAAAA